MPTLTRPHLPTFIGQLPTPGLLCGIALLTIGGLFVTDKALAYTAQTLRATASAKAEAIPPAGTQKTRPAATKAMSTVQPTPTENAVPGFLRVNEASSYTTDDGAVPIPQGPPRGSRFRRDQW